MALQLGKVNCIAEWKNENNEYTNLKSLYIGKIKIASYCFDGTTSKSDVKKYRVYTYFLSLKPEFTKFETPKECEDICLKIANTFVKDLNPKIESKVSKTDK
jgi:hypothetical protein